MKAILILNEMPSQCIECPFHTIYADDMSFTATHCTLTAERNEDGVNTRAEWCPLKPLPTKFKTYKLSQRDQEETELFIDMAMLKVYADGYNACLEEIER